MKTINDIQIGDGATLTPHTDCFPATVIRKTATTVIVREDNATVIKGSTHNGSAEYVYSTNPDGRTFVVRMTKRGWRAGHLRVSFEGRRAYYDPHF